MAIDVIETEILSAQENMDFDKDLLLRANELKRPVLHLYQWKRPSATIGHFIKAEKFFTPKADHFIDIGKRVTGGGIIFHDSDLAFALVFPLSHPLITTNTLENYALVNQLIIKAIMQFCDQYCLSLLNKDAIADSACERFCMAKPTIYDVIIAGRKVGGAAQRRTKEGLLHHGSIALKRPNKELLMHCLLQGEIIAKAMEENTFPLLEDCSLDAFQNIKSLLIQTFNKAI